MDLVEIFNISLDLSTIYFAYFIGCSCNSFLECYNLFSGVEYKIVSFYSKYEVELGSVLHWHGAPMLFAIL